MKILLYKPKICYNVSDKVKMKAGIISFLSVIAAPIVAFSANEGVPSSAGSSLFSPRVRGLPLRYITLERRSPFPPRV